MTNSQEAFTFDSLADEKPLTFKQLRAFFGNTALDYLFTEKLGLVRNELKVNRILFRQIASALQTATSEKPLTQKDLKMLQEKGASKAHLKIFDLAFKELYLTADEFDKALSKDATSIDKSEHKNAVQIFAKIKGEKTTAKKSVTVKAKSKKTKSLGIMKAVIPSPEKALTAKAYSNLSETQKSQVAKMRAEGLPLDVALSIITS